jgi:hypothetical protein
VPGREIDERDGPEPHFAEEGRTQHNSRQYLPDYLGLPQPGEQVSEQLGKANQQ